jgi:hypothetical protein
MSATHTVFEIPNLTALKPLMASVSTEDVMEVANKFDLAFVVERHAKEQNVSLGVSEELGEELKKFLVLCALNPNQQLGMAGPVDEIWHEFITHTKLYHKFCVKVAGQYLHHTPHSSPKPLQQDEGYLAFQSLYEKTFGEEAPAHIWPRIDASGGSMAQCGGSCGGGCNSGNCYS